MPQDKLVICILKIISEEGRAKDRELENSTLLLWLRINYFPMYLQSARLVRSDYRVYVSI